MAMLAGPRDMAAQGGEFGFRLHVVPIGRDDEGEPATSCVVVADTLAAPAPPISDAQADDDMRALLCLVHQSSGPVAAAHNSPRNPHAVLSGRPGYPRALASATAAHGVLRAAESRGYVTKQPYSSSKGNNGAKRWTLTASGEGFAVSGQQR